MVKKVLVGLFLVLCVAFGIYLGIGQVVAHKGIERIPNFFATKTPTTKIEASNPSGEKNAFSGETIVSMPTPTPTPENTKTIPEMRAIYVTGWSIGTKSVRDAIIANLKENNFNAIVIDIKDESGQLSYNSTVQTAIDIEASRNMVSNMSAVIEELHQNHIYVIGRIVTFKDAIFAGSPATVVCYREEDGNIWTDYQDESWPNPYNKNSWGYPIELAKEAAKLGFDEIQFDYVRFPQSEGKVSTIAYGFESNTKSKSDIICDFLSEAMRQLKPLGVTVSASVDGTITKKEGDFANIGQDFARIASIVDVICPTVYPSDFAYYEYKIDKPDLYPYEIVYNALKDALARINNYSGDKSTKIRPYLQDFTATWLGSGNFKNYTSTEVAKEMQAAYDTKLYSFTLWDPSNKYCFDALKGVSK